MAGRAAKILARLRGGRSFCIKRWKAGKSSTADFILDKRSISS